MSNVRNITTIPTRLAGRWAKLHASSQHPEYFGLGAPCFGGEGTMNAEIDERRAWFT